MQNTKALGALKTDQRTFLKHKITLNLIRNCIFFRISKGSSHTCLETILLETLFEIRSTFAFFWLFHCGKQNCR